RSALAMRAARIAPLDSCRCCDHLTAVLAGDYFFQAEGCIRDFHVTGVQTCALPIWMALLVGIAVFATAFTLLPAFSGDVLKARRSEERRVGKECSSRCLPDL